MRSLASHYRLASVGDIFRIMELYQEVYQGTYLDPLMNQFRLLKNFIETENQFWFVNDIDGELVASVVIRYDPENRLAKAFGAVVKNQYRRQGMMEIALKHAMDFVQENTAGVDVVYATTRTVHEAAQALTERLGFKKLGIFPNSHKNVEYETHCLVAYYYKNALAKRNTDCELHYQLKGLAQIVSQEVPELRSLQFVEPGESSRPLSPPPVLEMVETEHFVKYRYEQLKKEKELRFSFFPFHEPNVLLLSPDQSIEIFCYHSRSDGYSVVVGMKLTENVDYSALLHSIATLLRENQARYIELLVRADKPKVISSVLRAKFIPSALFPAFQLSRGMRYDYIIMSKTFEIFDFQNINLKGLNQKYLEEYYKHWERSSLNPKLLNL